MQKVTVDSVAIDYCMACSAAWLDGEEVERLLTIPATEQMQSKANSRPGWLGPISRLIKFVGALTTVVICLWILAYPRPYWAAICAAYVFVLIMTVAPLLAKDEFRLREPRSNPADNTRANLAVPLISISAVLAMRAFLDFDTVDGLNAVGLGFVAGTTYAVILWAIVPRASLGFAIAIGMFLGPAAALHFNAATLSAESYRERGVVAAKYVSSKPARHVIVASIGASKVELTTHKELYGTYLVGQAICTEVHVGAVGVGVRNIHPC